jgi:hypothetical protein
MFELHITCSKNIDKLNIDFSDGTTIVQEKHQIQKPVKEKIESKKETYLNIDDDFSNIQQEIIQKPIIENQERPIKIAQELQNFDF